MSRLEIAPSLNIPQAQFLNLPHKYKAMVCGYGTGKTWAGGSGICKHFWEYPKVNAGYFAPTYPLIRDVFYPTIEEVAADWGFDVEINQGNHEVHFYSYGFYRGTVICRSMDKPSNIVGFKIGHANVDEIDTMKLPKAELSWRKIIARMRAKDCKNDVNITTTPEGFNFVYKKFVKEVQEKAKKEKNSKIEYGLIQASTYENEANLPDGYIQGLLEDYPPNLITAYLNGHFCNLNSGSVYPNFDRRLNSTFEEIKKHEVLHIGMDFNVMKMSAVVHVIRNNKPMALNELYKVRDTPEMARLIKERWGEDHEILIYPDASGNNTSSKNYSESDLSILRQHGFKIIVDHANPRIKDRVLAMNSAFHNSLGERRYLVNVNNCPDYTESLEQQCYGANGEPDKSTGFDHLNDAGGYFIQKKFPIVKRGARMS